jgi:hypothetical protein
MRRDQPQEQADAAVDVAVGGGGRLDRDANGALPAPDMGAIAAPPARMQQQELVMLEGVHLGEIVVAHE